MTEQNDYKYFKPGTKARVISDGTHRWDPGTIVTILEDCKLSFCRDGEGNELSMWDDELEVIQEDNP